MSEVSSVLLSLRSDLHRRDLEDYVPDVERLHRRDLGFHPFAVGKPARLDLRQPLLFQFFGRKGPLLRLTTMRSSVMGRVCSELAYRARPFLRGRRFPALPVLCSAPETYLSKYRIIIKSKRSKYADRLAGLVEGFRPCLFGQALETPFQLIDLFDCRFLHIRSAHKDSGGPLPVSLASRPSAMLPSVIGSIGWPKRGI
jgi:hypothetical protein